MAQLTDEVYMLERVDKRDFYAKNQDEENSLSEIPSATTVRAQLFLPADSLNGYEESAVVGALFGKAEDPNNAISVTVSFQRLPFFRSFVEVRLRVAWRSEDDASNTDTIAFRFTEPALVTPDGQNEDFELHQTTCHANEEPLRQLFCISELMDDPRRLRWNDSELYVLYLNVNMADSVWVINSRNSRTYGSMTPMVQRIQAALTSNGQHRLLVSAVILDCAGSSLKESFRNERISQPTKPWSANGARSDMPFFIQDGTIPHRKNRPSQRYPPFITFPSFSHYQVALGFCMIYERERAQAAKDPIQRVRAVVIGLNGRGNSAYLVSAEIDRSRTILHSGDRVLVKFSNVSEEAWTGTVLDPPPYQRLNNISILANRPTIKNEDGTNTYRKFTPEIEPAFWVQDMTSPLIARNGLDYGTKSKAAGDKAIYIGVIPDVQGKVWRRQIDSLYALQSARDIPTTKNIIGLLTMNNIDSLPKVDAFRGLQPIASESTIDDTIEQVMTEYALTVEQRTVFTSMRAAPGGLSLLTGPPGVGKTRVTKALCDLATRCKLITPSQTPLNPSLAQVLFIAPVNQIINRFTKSLGDLMANRPNVLITRFHTPTVEKKLLLKRARDINPQASKCIQENDLQVLTHIHAAQMVSQSVEHATAQKNGIGDARVECPEFSLGTNIAKITGLLNPGSAQDISAELRTTDRYRAAYSKFLNGFAQWKAGQAMDLAESNAFTNAIGIMIDVTLQRSNIITCTPNLVGDAKLYASGINPFLIIGDEGARIPEADEWHSLARFPEAFQLRCGDTRQLKPMMLSRSECNPFAYQGSVTLLARGQAAGIPTTRLTKTNRFSTPVAQAVQLVYPSKGFEIPNPNPRDKDPFMETIRDFNKKLFGQSSTTLIVSVKNSTCQGVMFATSKYNEKSAAAAIYVLEQAVINGLNLDDLALLTPYEFQRQLHTHGVGTLKLKYPDLSWDSLYIGTFDQYQGEEKRFPILDLVAVESLGFLRQDNRPNCGLSRAIYGYIVIASEHLPRAQGFSASALSKLWSLHARAGTICKFDPTIALETIDEVLPSTLRAIDLGYGPGSREQSLTGNSSTATAADTQDSTGDTGGEVTETPEASKKETSDTAEEGEAVKRDDAFTDLAESP